MVGDTLYRYELVCNGEPQDVGFLVGLEELGLNSDKEEYLLEPFNQELSIPSTPYMRNSVSLFTENGKEKFQKYVDRVIEAYKNSIFDVVCVTTFLSKKYKNFVVYQDENQVCLDKKAYKKMPKSVEIVSEKEGRLNDR